MACIQEFKTKCVFILLILSYFISNICGQINDSRRLTLQSLEKLSDLNRPMIYAFLYIEGSNVSLNDASMVIWAEAWFDAGWEPIILTEADSGRHPDYEKYMNKLSFSGLPQGQWGRLLRYLAMASLPRNGGWCTEISILPVRHADSFDGKGFDLPYNGTFTVHDPHIPLLLSANNQQWHEIASVIINEEPDNDALILHTLMRENKNKIFIEDSLIHVKDVLISKNCADLEKKIATKLSTGIIPLEFKNHDEYNEVVTSILEKCKQTTKISFQNCKPTMYTFYELDLKLSVKTLWSQLDSWSLAWREAGWNTIVLNLNDAKKHPLYEHFRQAFENATIKISEKDKMCFYRWLAMAALPDGGWMSEYDTFPLNLHHYTSCNLPNHGTFTINEQHVPSLASGSNSEWSRMVQLLLSNYQLNQSNQKIFWSDTAVLEDIYKHQNTAFIQTNDSISIYNVYSNPPTYMRFSYSSALFIDLNAVYHAPFHLRKFCHSTSTKLSVHFSRESCRLAKFCNVDRGPIFTKWLIAWKKYCYRNNKKNDYWMEK